MKAMARRHQLRRTEALARDWMDCLTATTRKLESLEKDVRKRLDALSSLWRKKESG
jgi:hypothetical protein